MGIITSQQIQNYYDLFRDTEVAYTKDVLRTLAVDPRQICVKCNGAQWPCIINSTSFQFAKIIVGTKGGAFAELAKKEPPPVNIRFYFIQQHGQPISFFITGRVTQISQYMNSSELAIVTITFTQRPPDNLIEKVGSMLEANSNAVRRKEERIIITEDSKRRLGISKDETIVFIQNVPRKCILRNISFSGAKIILLGIEKFINGKETVLRIRFDDPDEIISLEGTVVKTSPLENRAEIIYACIKFNEQKVPTSYKIRINTYITTMRKTILGAAQNEQNRENENRAEPQKAPAKTSAPEQSANEMQKPEPQPAAKSVPQTASVSETARVPEAQQSGTKEENTSAENEIQEAALPEMPDI